MKKIEKKNEKKKKNRRVDERNNLQHDCTDQNCHLIGKISTDSPLH